MASPPALEIRDVSLRLGGQTILDRVSWRVQSGEHWAVLGPNGAGKTTLLRVACGYLWPNAGGSVLRDGSAMLDLRELRKRIGWVSSTLVAKIPPHEPALDTVVSGRFAQTGLKPIGSERATPADYRQAAEMLATLGGADITDRPFGVLSQGEQQKVLIARARMARPWMVILDEPCAGLDPGSREELLRSLQQLAAAEKQCSLILVTHHIEEIMPAFTRTLVMQDARVTHADATEKVIDAGLMETLYGARVSRIHRENGRYWPIW